jgi:hypothetical protein
LLERGFPFVEIETGTHFISGSNEEDTFVRERRSALNAILETGKINLKPSEHKHLRSSILDLAFHDWTVNLLSALTPRARRVFISYAKEYYSRGMVVSYAVDYFDETINHKPDVREGIKK